MTRHAGVHLRTFLLLLVGIALFPSVVLLAATLGGQAEPGASAEGLFLRALAALPLVAMLAFGAAWLVSEYYFVRPTARLVAASKRLAEGDLAARAALTKGPEELVRLGATFDEMAAALQRQTEELREVDLLKSQILNTAAHELNTPITPIKVQLRLLSATGELSEKQAKAVGLMHRNVDRLSVLVQDMLDVARIQNGRFQIAAQRIDLARTLEETLQTLEPSARSHDIALEAEIAGELRVDAEAARIAQVIVNLVGNAIKFTPRDGMVRVVARASDGQAILEVSDSGAGFAPAQHERLFAPFAHAHDPREDPRVGAGLGLYISKGIIGAHGGRIWGSSPGADQGATFGFSLPLATQAIPQRDVASLGRP